MKRDGRIRFFQLAENVGAWPKRVIVESEKRRKVNIITFMDCDDISLPQRLQMQVDIPGLTSRRSWAPLESSGQLVICRISQQ